MEAITNYSETEKTYTNSFLLTKFQLHYAHMLHVEPNQKHISLLK